MRRYGSFSLAAAVALAAGLGTVVTPSNSTGAPEMRAPTQANGQNPAQTTQVKVAAQDAAFVNWWRRIRATRERRSGPGWSNRHVQRMARKRRNQARHRRACR